MTKYLLFSGELIDATTALRAGLVDRLVDADDLDDEVRRFADVLASRSALTQRATKEVVADLAGGGDGAAVVAPLVPRDDRVRGARRGCDRLHRTPSAAISLVRLTGRFRFDLPGCSRGYQSREALPEEGGRRGCRATPASPAHPAEPRAHGCAGFVGGEERPHRPPNQKTAEEDR